MYIQNGDFRDNTATGFGGAIINRGNLTLEDSAFYRNSASAGGAVFNAGVLTSNKTRFYDSVANDDGGGLYNISETLVILNENRFEDNRATNEGGGVYNFGIIYSQNIIYEDNTCAGNLILDMRGNTSERAEGCIGEVLE